MVCTMKIYLAYQYTGKNKTKLKENLEKISSSLEQKGHNTFIFLRNINNWGEKEIETKNIIPLAFKEIKNSDLLFIFIDKYSASTGIGLEIGYAKALGIPVVIAIRENDSDNYLLSLYDKLIEYKDFEDLLNKIEMTEF